MPFQRCYLIALGHKHYKLGIPKKLFHEFQQVLIDVIRDFHADAWSESLEEEWTAAVAQGVTVMFEGYTDELPDGIGRVAKTVSFAGHGP